MPLFAHRLIPLILSSHLHGHNLAGKWNYCLPIIQAGGPIDLSSIPCSWTTTELPNHNPSQKRHRTFSWQLFSTFFKTPKGCIDESNCFFVLGEASEWVEVQINNISLGSSGKDDLNLSKMRPIEFKIPPNTLLKDRTKDNKIQILLYSAPNRPFAGITKGPIAILPTHGTKIVHEALISETVLLPIFAAISLLLLTITITAFLGKNNDFENFSKLLNNFCIFNFLYLISLSRLPREHLNYKISYNIHFSFLFLSQYSLLSLLEAFLIKKTKTIKSVKSLLLGIAAIPFTYGVLIYLRPGLEIFRTYDLAMILYPICPVALFAFLKDRNSINEAERSSLVKLTSLILLFQISDIITFYGYFSEIYFARIMPLIIGCYISLLVFKRWLEKQSDLKTIAKIGDIVSNIAHDLRSPIFALKAVGSKLTANTEERSIIIDACNQINRIAEQVLDQSRKHNNIEPTLADSTQIIVLERYIKEVLNSKSYEFSTQKDIQIADNIDYSKSHLVLADPILLMRIISNIINNSYDALANTTGRITVNIKETNKYILCIIEDNGPGIDKNLLQHLRSLNYRSTKKTGNGLGIKSAILNMQTWGGDLEIYSSSARGTKLTLKFLRATNSK